jgi:hypothetical protein
MIGFLQGVIITTNSGTFGLTWAQQSSSTEASTLQKGSCMVLTKLN